MKALLASVVAGSMATAVAATCPADRCFTGVKLAPILNKAASVFCLNYVKPTPNLTTTKTVKVTSTTTSTPAAPVQTNTVTATVTSTSGTVCTTTVSAGLSTSTSFAAPSGAIRRREADLDVEAEELAKRQVAAVPNNLRAGCKETGRALTAKISSACTCFLTPTATRTVTSTAVVTQGGAIPIAVTVQTTITSTVAESTCTSTSTVTLPGARSCGVPVQSYTSGTVTCASAVAPGATNALFRIEGGDAEGTIFEGCIESGPRDITTPSGGTHRCDGTNGNANPSPGATLTTQIDAAAQLLSFSYDGSYSTSFQDFFITSIGGRAQTSNQFWGVLRNEAFTSRGGCQEYATSGDRGLWAFDAFNANGFLKLSTNYAAVAPGSTVSTTVLRADANGGGIQPYGGASIFGTTSNANGQATFTAPMNTGCYLYKATANGFIRSDTFYLSVF